MLMKRADKYPDTCIQRSHGVTVLVFGGVGYADATEEWDCCTRAVCPPLNSWLLSSQMQALIKAIALMNEECDF